MGEMLKDFDRAAAYHNLMKFTLLPILLVPALLSPFCDCIAGDAPKTRIIPGPRIGGLIAEFRQWHIQFGEDDGSPKEYIDVLSTVRFRDVRTNAVYELAWMRWNEPLFDADTFTTTNICSPDGSWVAIPLFTGGVYFESSATFPESVRTGRSRGFVVKYVGKDHPIIMSHRLEGWKGNHLAVLTLNASADDPCRVVVNLKTKEITGNRFNFMEPRFEPIKKLFVRGRLKSPDE